MLQKNIFEQQSSLARGQNRSKITEAAETTLAGLEN